MNFNEKEVGRLIHRATELHEQSVGDSEHNLSLAEIESIAGELGIPVRFLQEAALEIKEGRTANTSFSIWGAPFMVEQSRLAEGILSDEEWEKVLLELQDYSGETGSSGNVGLARHWLHEVGEGERGFSLEKLKVTMRPSEGRTSIHIRQDYKGAVLMYVMAFGIISLLTLMVSHSLPDISKIAELMYAGLGGLLSLVGVRVLVAASAKRYREKLSKLADQLHQIVDHSQAVAERVEVASGELDILDYDSYKTDLDRTESSPRTKER